MSNLILSALDFNGAKVLMARFTEKDWNEYSTQVCEEKNRDAPAGDKYRGKSPSRFRPT
jgi:hypothetical protein